MLSRTHPDLKEVVSRASLALARLDADRLEELALSCEALNRELEPADPVRHKELEREARAAVHEMAVFARVLEATRANLKVMHRLRELRACRLEYGEGLDRQRTVMESWHGNN